MTLVKNQTTADLASRDGSGCPNVKPEPGLGPGPDVPKSQTIKGSRFARPNWKKKSGEHNIFLRRWSDQMAHEINQTTTDLASRDGVGGKSQDRRYKPIIKGEFNVNFIFINHSNGGPS